MCSCSRRWDYRRLLGGLTWLKLKTHDWRSAATPSGLAQMPSAWMWWQVASCSILPLPFNCPSLPFLNTFTVIDNHHWKLEVRSFFRFIYLLSHITFTYETWILLFLPVQLLDWLFSILASSTSGLLIHCQQQTKNSAEALQKCNARQLLYFINKDDNNCYIQHLAGIYFSRI